jgi:large subunit ribosomal protein L1
MVPDDDDRGHRHSGPSAEGAATEALAKAAAATAAKKPSFKRPRKRPASKRFKTALQVRGDDLLKTYTIEDAVTLIKKMKGPKFDESMETHLKLGIDAKKSDQQIRGTFVFPHGVGKEKRVIAFAEGALADAARAAGALEVGGAELAKKIEDGWFEFDVVIAHPGMMRVVGKLGKVLGPKKLMPNPKEGSVTADVVTAVKEFKAGKASYRVDEGANLHAIFGKKSFEVKKLKENLEAFLEHVKTLRPPTSKGVFVQKGSICSTMSPGVRIDVGHLAL